jgi:hypothetical protein
MCISNFLYTEIIDMLHILLDFTFFELWNGDLSMVFGDEGYEFFIFLNIFVAFFNILIEFDD